MEPWIVSDIEVLGGRPHIRGTRLAVAFLLELLASGGTREAILAAYPQLTGDGLDAALRYAAEALGDDLVWDTRVPA